MGEYQYYEFTAIDRPLTPREMDALRRVSTRAVITPRGFTNHYEWGGLKAEPSDWMRRYFDAFVWVSDGGFCELMLRVPSAVLEGGSAQYSTRSAFTLAAAKDRSVLRWTLNETDDYERFAEEDGRSWTGRLLPLRDEILRGDRRPLYLGWLAGVTAGEVTDRALEPDLPSGLAALTPAQQALVEFLGIDVDLLAAAAGDSPPLPASDAHEAEHIDAWLYQLSSAELRATVTMLLQGKTHQAERVARSRFLDWQRQQATVVSAVPTRRSVEHLRMLADAAEQQRLSRERKERERRLAKERRQREAHLHALATNAQRAWNSIERLAERGTATGYDAASRALSELSEACSLASRSTEFHHALRRFVIRHDRRKALIKRLVKSGVWRG